MLNIGIINYINTLPLRQHLHELPQDRFYLEFGNPAELNAKILEGSVDISLMSAFAYLKHQDTLQRVPGIGIAAEHECLSVCLVSRVPPSELTDITVAGTKESASSVNLARVLFERHWKAQPLFQMGVEKENLHQYPAYVIIGNNCLTDEIPEGMTSYDLATAWHEMTGLPFTFGVLACRKDLSPDKRALIPALVQNFFQSLETSLEHPQKVVQQAKKELPITNEILEKYYKVLQFALTQKHEKGMALFQTFIESAQQLEPAKV